MNHPRYRDLTALAGWLFADLLLGLMVLFLISAPGAASRALVCLLTPTTTVTLRPTAAPQQMMKLSFAEEHGRLVVSTALVAASRNQPPTAFVPTFVCPTPTPTPPPTPTPTPDKNALSKTSLDFNFSTNADALLNGNPSETARLQTLIRQQIGAKVKADDQAGFVLSFGTSPSPAEGATLAADFDKILKKTLPYLFSRATFREFHDIGPDRGDILLNVYLYVVGGSSSTP
jgi:hypothetical protein